MKLLITILLFAPFAKPLTKITSAHTEYVYVCDSKTSYTYHSRKDCVGLDDCANDIIRVAVDDAVNQYKRKPCRKCSKASHGWRLYIASAHNIKRTSTDSKWKA